MSSTKRLQYLIDSMPELLAAIGEEEFVFKASPEKWSKKEILGHLIDSATNNHHRFIRAQYEDVPVVFYNQDQWNALSHYNEMPTDHIIRFWKIYNEHLLAILRHIPDEALSRECNTGGDSHPTLGWLIEDYVRHLEHHLHQIGGF